MCGFIAQLVEHRTGIAEVTGSNPVEALIFFRLLSNCLNWKFTAMITLHFLLQPQYNYEIFHINFTCCDMSGIVGSNLTSFKRSQHFNATYRTLLGATCCVRFATLLRHVGCFLLKFENGQIFHATFVDVAWSWCSASPVSASCSSRILMQMNDEVRKRKRQSLSESCARQICGFRSSFIWAI